MPTILVLHCPAGGGHRAAAHAIAEAAVELGVTCEVLDALSLTPPWFARAYVGAHLTSTEHAPWLYGAGFAAMNRRRHGITDELRGAFDRTAGHRLRRRVLQIAPSVVVATHFFPLAALGRARQTGELSAALVGVVTDYAAHAFWAEPGVDRYCAPSGRAPRDLVRHGAAPESIVATGIPIRGAFGRIPAFALPDAVAPLRVLVTSGGFGVGPVVQVIRSFADPVRSGARVHLTVVCGDNRNRVEQARRAARDASVPAKIIGFERDMPARLAESHVVIGKPGGLTASECLAAGRPMVVVGACPGQEMLNQRWLIESGAAALATSTDAGRVALDLASSGALRALAENARALSAPDAARRVVEVALRVAEPAPSRRAA